MTDPRRVLVVAVDRTASTVITCLRPLSALDAEVDLRVRSPQNCRPDDLRWAEVVVFSRTLDWRSLRAFRMAQAMGTPVLYQLDDALFDAQPTADSDVVLQPASLLRLVEFLTMATQVHLSSTRLYDRVQHLGGAARLAPTYFDPQFLTESLDHATDDVHRVVFPTFRQDPAATRRLTVGCLQAMLNEIPDIEIHMWRQEPALRGHPRVVVHPITFDLETFLRELQALRPAIGLAFLGPSAFEQAKSNVKFRDFAGIGIPGIYSDVPVYSRSVTQGVHGLLCGDDPAQWVESVKLLKRDAALRRSVVTAARERVLADYSLDSMLDFWRRCLAEARAEPRRLTAVPVSVGFDSTVPFDERVALLAQLIRVWPATRGTPGAEGVSVRIGQETSTVMAGGPAFTVEPACPGFDWIPEGRRLAYDPAAQAGPSSRAFAHAYAVFLAAREFGGLPALGGPPPDSTDTHGRAALRYNRRLDTRARVRSLGERVRKATPEYLWRYAQHRLRVRRMHQGA